MGKKYTLFLSGYFTGGNYYEDLSFSVDLKKFLVTNKKYEVTTCFETESLGTTDYASITVFGNFNTPMATSQPAQRYTVLGTAQPVLAYQAVGASPQFKYYLSQQDSFVQTLESPHFLYPIVIRVETNSSSLPNFPNGAYYGINLTFEECD